MVAKPKSARAVKAQQQKSKSTKRIAPKNAKSVKVPAKKAVKKKRALKKPIITAAMFENYFYKLSLEQFVELTKEWNETQLKIKIPKHDNYDQWLNYFKTLSPNVIKQMAVTGLDFLPTEAYAALSRWHDIISHPGRIDKIHQAGLTNADKRRPEQDIVALAQKNDRMGVLKAVRDSIAEKLAKGAGSRDTAALAREMGDILDQIAELEKHQGPRKGTVLSNLLGEFDVKKQRSKTGGARNTSFKSRVTIDDTEGK